MLLTSFNILIVSAFLMLLCARSRKICGYLFLSSLLTACSIGLYAALHVLRSNTPADSPVRWHFPFGEFYIGVDLLSAFFLLLFFILTLAAGIYGYGYLREYTGTRSLGAHFFFYHLLAASIVLALIAKNAVLFLIGWELMTVSTYFLITFYDEKEAIRKAGYIYLITTHTGTFCLLVMFLLMGAQAGTMNFDQMMLAQFSPRLTAFLFLLALAGFGIKAGFIPLHIWLPHAHPAAPSHVSALLSGAVIKIGIYGLLRFILIVQHFPSWCGVLLLVIGAVSGVGGVLYALGQHEIKKLLAYHSIENIGIITLGLGMGMMGQAFHQDTVAIIGYTGALLHVFNHAVFKGLLFLSAGSVIRATHTGEIDHMGGLLKPLPWTGHLFLIGSLSICGLPFFNGFISEWLVYQALWGGVLHFHVQGIITSCLGVAALALIGGLAAYCFAKAFGTVFLGKNRSRADHPCRENDLMLCGPMAGLAAICVWVGLAPATAVSFSILAAQTITGTAVPPQMAAIIVGPLLQMIGALLLGAFIFATLAVLRAILLKFHPVRGSETWGCGYALPSARMQYTASSFAAPLLRIFKTLLIFKTRTTRSKKYFPAEAALHSSVLDASEHLFFRPIFYRMKRYSKYLNWIQSGHTQRYLLYIFFFLLVLLIWKLR